MKRVLVLLTLVLLTVCLSVQAEEPGLLNNYQSDYVVLTQDQYAFGDDVPVRPVEAFVYGLASGMNLYGFGFGLNVSTGKNRPEIGDDTKKDASIGLNTTFYYERMLCHTFALGAVMQYAITNLTVNREGDGRISEHLLLMGLVGTFYWGFGELNRGGILAAMLLGAGFYALRADDDFFENTRSPVVQMGLNVGGWVMATKCLMFFAYIGLLNYEIQWMNNISGVDMTTHDLNLGISTWSPTLGLRFICGGRDHVRQARKRTSKINHALLY